MMVSIDEELEAAMIKFGKQIDKKIQAELKRWKSSKKQQKPKK